MWTALVALFVYSQSFRQGAVLHQHKRETNERLLIPFYSTCPWQSHLNPLVAVKPHVGHNVSLLWLCINTVLFFSPTLDAGSSCSLTMADWKWFRMEPLGLPPAASVIGSIFCAYEEQSAYLQGHFFPRCQSFGWPLGGTSWFEEPMLALRGGAAAPRSWKIQVLWVYSEHYRLGCTVIIVRITFSTQTTEE